MQKILILGAGRSSPSAINYLANNTANQFSITVADLKQELAQKQIQGLPNCRAIGLDISKQDLLKKEIEAHDLIISMLPASFNYGLIKAAIAQKKHVLTPSYQSKEVLALHQSAKENGVLVLNEMGLDPGIDHMSAMQIFDDLGDKGAMIKSFKSYTGGLVAPESDDNPWGYKFSWNPRNVIIAGQGGAAKYLENGQEKYIPYHKLFSRLEQINVQGYGEFEGYANRDSLAYQKIYGLDNIETLLRGTLRKKGYSQAWDALVQLGMTDDGYQMKASSYADFTASFLPNSKSAGLAELASYLGVEASGDTIKKLSWLGLFDGTKKQLNASPAKILQDLLEEKWALKPDDKDMIVMSHEIIYELDNTTKRLEANLVLLGKDSVHTAMAMTVGYPIAIAAQLLLNGKLKLSGVRLPVTKDIYQPVLKELKKLGIGFSEKLTDV